jgi:hypothetical protein
VEGPVGSDEKVTGAEQGQCQCVVRNCKVCTYPMICTYRQKYKPRLLNSAASVVQSPVFQIIHICGYNISRVLRSIIV